MWAVGPMPNVMAALQNIGGALWESSVIPLFVPRRKVWLMPAAGVPCSNAAKTGNARRGCKVNFAPGKIPLWGKSPENVYIVYQPRRRTNIVQSLVDFR